MVPPSYLSGLEDLFNWEAVEDGTCSALEDGETGERLLRFGLPPGAIVRAAEEALSRKGE